MGVHVYVNVFIDQSGGVPMNSWNIGMTELVEFLNLN